MPFNGFLCETDLCLNLRLDPGPQSTSKQFHSLIMNVFDSAYVHVMHVILVWRASTALKVSPIITSQLLSKERTSRTVCCQFTLFAVPFMCTCFHLDVVFLTEGSNERESS